MQKWEYITITVTPHYKDDRNWIVYSVNEQIVAREIKEKKAGLTQYDGESLHAFLNRAGGDGWELISHAVADPIFHTLIFKRPYQNVVEM